MSMENKYIEYYQIFMEIHGNNSLLNYMTWKLWNLQEGIIRYDNSYYSSTGKDFWLLSETG